VLGAEPYLCANLPKVFHGLIRNWKMLWHGNECGKNKSNENFKTTIPSVIMIDQNQLENVECFKYLGSILTNDGRYMCVKLNPGLPWQKLHSTRRRLSLPANWT
jgi:hypothetical protein